MKIKITEVNVQTGEETTFEREETPQEEATRLEVKARLDRQTSKTKTLPCVGFFIGKGKPGVDKV